MDRQTHRRTGAKKGILTGEMPDKVNCLSPILSPRQLPPPFRTPDGWAAYQLLLPKAGYLALRRWGEAVLSLGLLTALAPLMGAIGWRIHREDGGPVFYRQKRVGRYGRPFFICKFRTMTVGQERWGPLTLDGDKRITQVGAFLRRTRLDELPQLWNILRGEMSLVGPRPEVPDYVREYTPAMWATLLVPPGLTSRASLYFRRESLLLCGPHPEEVYRQRLLPAKMALNEAYLRDLSFAEDCKIIAATAAVLWGRRD